MQPTDASETTIYRFSRRELERLAIYRAAIEAEFYTDHCEPIGLNGHRESVWPTAHLPAA
jgi:hypothetical protein